MAPLSDCYSFAFDRLQKNLWFYLIAGLLICLGPLVLGQIAQLLVGVAVGVGGGMAKWSPEKIKIVSLLGSLPFSLLFSLLPLPLYATFFKGMANEEAGRDAEVASLFAIGRYFVPSILVGVLTGLIVLAACIPSIGLLVFAFYLEGLASILAYCAGILLYLVPWILLAPLFNMAIYFVARGGGATDSIGKSLALLLAHPLTIAYWWGIFLPFGLLGLFVCCIGVTVTLPMSLAAFYFMMRSLEGPVAPAAIEPPPIPAA